MGATTDRGLNVILDFVCDTIADPPCEMVEERHLGDGFIGVLFDSPREAEGFILHGGGNFGFTADNFVVAAFPIPEPSTLSLVAAAVPVTITLAHRQTGPPSRRA